MLGPERARAVFAGVVTLGVSAGELHEDGEEGEVKRKVQAATGRLIADDGGGEGRVSVVVLGCAGMAGMEEWVREKVKKRGVDVRVVDGVKAGVGILQGLVRGNF